MAGFTLYETLRILIPGVITMLTLDMTLRIGFGASPFAEDGGMADFLDFLESVAGFSALSLLAGLLLYMIDLPAKLRIFLGDPGRDRSLPSETLRELMKGSKWESDATGLYFTLSDRYLPAEMHKRVYLFGSLYRIFVDLRVVLATAVVVGIAASQVAAGDVSTGMSRVDADSGAARSVFILLLGMLAVGSFGIRRHAFFYTRKHRKETPSRTYAAQVWPDVKAVGLVTLLVLGLGAASSLMLATKSGELRVVGLLLVLAQLWLWLMLEVGPPHEKQDDSWRSGILMMLRAKRGQDVQYAAVQRLLYDIGLFLPWTLGATWVNAVLERAPTSVLAWGMLMLPATAVMSFRKHEERILSVYKEQSVWLELHKTDIEKIKTSGQLPDHWN